jgi:Gram-negative porin
MLLRLRPYDEELHIIKGGMLNTMLVKNFKSLQLLPLAAVLASLGAQAQSADSAFSFSGFATIGVAGSNTDDAQYVVPGQVRGADKSWSGEVDSKLGLQATYRLNSMFSGTAQLLTKHNGEGNFTPELEWAFVKAQLLPSLALRAGRMGGPIFAVSDFRDVGYSNIWLRPPIDVYGQVSVSHFDGADALYQTNVGAAAVSAQVFTGASSAHFDRTKLKLKEIVGFNVTTELDGGVTLRLGRAQGKLTVDSADLSSLTAGLQAVPLASVSSVGDQLSAKSKDASFTGFGLVFDRGNWLFNAEYTMRRTDSYVPDTTGWYTTLGYRVGKFTPYLTLSRLKVDDSNVDNTIPLGVSDELSALKVVVDGVVASQQISQKTVALGLRWDAMRNVAVKAQFDRIRPDAGGFFVRTEAGFGGSHVNVYSLAVDMVF